MTRIIATWWLNADGSVKEAVDWRPAVMKGVSTRPRRIGRLGGHLAFGSRPWPSGAEGQDGR
jgi:hypothetical protein